MGEVMTPLLTINRAAAIVDCHPETLRRAIRAGKLAAYRRPGNTRISETDLKAYLDTYHCPATEMTSRTWNYDGANGALSGGKKENVTGYRLGQRMRNALDKR